MNKGIFLLAVLLMVLFSFSSNSFSKENDSAKEIERGKRDKIEVENGFIYITFEEVKEDYCYIKIEIQEKGKLPTAYRLSFYAPTGQTEFNVDKKILQVFHIESEDSEEGKLAFWLR